MFMSENSSFHVLPGVVWYSPCLRFSRDKQAPYKYVVRLDSSFFLCWAKLNDFVLAFYVLLSKIISQRHFPCHFSTDKNNDHGILGRPNTTTERQYVKEINSKLRRTTIPRASPSFQLCLILRGCSLALLTFDP